MLGAGAHQITELVDAFRRPAPDRDADGHVRVLVACAEPERRIQLLYRPRLQWDIFETPEITGEGGARLGPQRLHHLYGLHEAARPAFTRHTEDSFGHVRPADSDTDSQPALAQLIERGEGLGQLHRIANYRQQ